jgi:hypothetical protein
LQWSWWHELRSALANTIVAIALFALLDRFKQRTGYQDWAVAAMRGRLGFAGASASRPADSFQMEGSVSIL